MNGHDLDLIYKQNKYQESLIDIEAAEMRFMTACGANVFKDGDKWCCLSGDNLQEGIAGFGDTPLGAVIEHNVFWRMGK